MLPRKEIEKLYRATLGSMCNYTSIVGVIGLGYVGLPLAISSAEASFDTIGFDTDEKKLLKLRVGNSYIDAVNSACLKRHVNSGKFAVTSDMARLNACDVIIICVPTPLTPQREPDLSYVILTTEFIAKTLRAGQTIILESTTWPGTTMQVLRPILEKTGLISGKDFFLGFSPEREDPGNKEHSTVTIPKIVSGDGEYSSRIVEMFYSKIVQEAIPVSTTDTAEAVKITENIFRAVNIALVNELKVVYDAMGIDIWEVIDAAKTKPFGYMPFYPGPGLGGHCIPIDPFYLTWRAREFDIATRFIELAGEVNRAMPTYVVQQLEKALDKYQGKSLGRSRVLILGVAYKKNVADVRESPAFKIMELLSARAALFDYHDAHVKIIPATRDHMTFEGLQSVDIGPDKLSIYDAVIIATDHDAVDYNEILCSSKLVVDTRNVMHGLSASSSAAIVVKA